MEKIILFGTSAGTKLAHFILSQDPGYEVTAFTIDREYIKEASFCGLPVIPFEEVQELYPPVHYKMFVAIFANGMNMLRAKKCDEARDKGYTLISYIHPKAIVASDLVIGDNCFISEGVICRPFSRLGNDVILMPGALIGHDTNVMDHCFIGNRAVVMGVVTIEPFCLIGPNATIMETITVARECLIGGGVVLQASTKEREVYKAPAPICLPLSSDKLAKLIFRRST